ncbi:MAG TPA: hypothetical protein VD908_19245 [Cytophagales bacterium]|nr:hypothetical protein [Cytophagales bacterium]
MRVKYKTGVEVNLRLRFAFFSLSLLAILTVFLLVQDFVITQESMARPNIETRKKLILNGLSKEGETFQDSRPLISPDGKQLFFGRRNHPNNIGGESDFQDIWMASLDSTGNFEKIRSLGTIINNSKPNGICSISPNGSEIILTNEYGGAKQSPISISTKTKGIWSKPKPMFIEDYYNKGRYEDFYMSFEQKVLLLAVERRDGIGDQDIYVCLPDENGNWKKPINLGTAINTKTAEFAPYLGSDGKTLFFASYREGGLGESDIYVTTRMDDSWTNWSAPKNLGPTINTPEEESYFSITSDFESIFVESYTKGNIERDIFQVKLPLEFKPQKENLMVSNQ